MLTLLFQVKQVRTCFVFRLQCRRETESIELLYDGQTSLVKFLARAGDKVDVDFVVFNNANRSVIVGASLAYGELEMCALTPLIC